MGVRVKYPVVTPLPKATVKYTPESQVLYFENGSIREDASDMAQNIIAYYGKEDETEVVAIRIDHAEIVLKPFVDAILAKYGLKVPTPPRDAAAQD